MLDAIRSIERLPKTALVALMLATIVISMLLTVVA